MRGDSTQQAIMLSAVTPDSLVPADHPIRQIKPIVDRVLQELSPVFRQMYPRWGRPSIPPEHLLKALLLKSLFSVRSERQLCERLQYDLLFKWFLDLNISDAGFDASTFSKNRERLLEHEVAAHFFAAVVDEARRQQLLSSEHFTVRRHTPGSVGVDEERAPARQRGTAARGWQEPRRGLPEPAAEQPDARVDDRPGCADGTEE